MRGLVVLLALSLVVPLVGGQDSPSYVFLGEDATGDPNVNGAPMPDTWIDINSLAVETVGEDLVFYLGLQGDTTEAGSYCWMAAFEFGGTEYVGLDCYEAVAYTNDNSLSGVRAPDTSRGENVASSVVFEGSAAKITVPLANIGAAIGDEIHDIYGLTYATRVLSVVDTIPDAKRTAAADESLGSYRIGGPALVETPTEVPTVNETVAPIVQNVTGDSFDERLSFDAPSNDTYTFLWGGIPNGTASWNVTGNGSIEASVTANGTSLLQGPLSGNGTVAFADVAGPVNVTLRFDAFVGEVQLRIEAPQHDAPAPVNETADPTLEDEESPGAGLLMALFAVALAVVSRRRNA